ncbi:hypothetical protein DY000_02040296 [Brassica cretica]|uniref:Uncharacterized protein n=1 Tax=Brassica cretica TaxID=69181 RepID=A0ABQ7BF26_BRACR|nr:hypothetical protein DY000_02040296 [Brassica cretica]
MMRQTVSLNPVTSLSLATRRPTTPLKPVTSLTQMMNVAYMNVMVADYKNKMACVLPRLRKIEGALKEKTKKYRKAKKEMGHAEKVTGQRGGRAKQASLARSSFQYGEVLRETSFEGYMPSSTRSNKETQLLFSSDHASLERSIRKEIRSSSIDNNTCSSLDFCQPPSTQTLVSSTYTRSPPSTEDTHLPSTDIFHPTSIDTSVRTSIDTEP